MDPLVDTILKLSNDISVHVPMDIVNLIAEYVGPNPVLFHFKILKSAPDKHPLLADPSIKYIIGLGWYPLPLRRVSKRLCHKCLTGNGFDGNKRRRIGIPRCNENIDGLNVKYQCIDCILNEIVSNPLPPSMPDEVKHELYMRRRRNVANSNTLELDTFIFNYGDVYMDMEKPDDLSCIVSKSILLASAKRENRETPITSHYDRCSVTEMFSI